MPGAHKIGAAISDPRIAGGKIVDTRLFLNLLYRWKVFWNESLVADAETAVLWWGGRRADKRDFGHNFWFIAQIQIQRNIIFE